ncbi:hypothetical protein [Mangrovibacterium diazotrophicum]|uniref:Uncharacterized protein n=1 Tax=Mangrovibacterium diazotrophicum TaxID=1261403 RepID=A0A419WB29_9BACT|nr:hypothetical protein [Mangrovibacterium diazotrophicum]RKD92657.1 hypothetical protein BC643_3032 [Mangrovibacterium diazotrophicum]
MELVERLKQIKNQLIENDSIQLVSDCLTAMNREEIYFEDHDTLPRSIVEENYHDKFAVQKNILHEERVLGYTDLLKSLKQFRGDNVHLYTVASSDSVFILFFNEDNDHLIGLLRTFSQRKQDLEKLNREYREKGLDVAGISIKISE